MSTGKWLAVALLSRCLALGAEGCRGGERPAGADSGAVLASALAGERALITGRVVLDAQHDPPTLVYAEGGTPVGIIGGLVTELQRLAGARVTVIGHASGSHGEVVEASRYAVLEVNGEKPHIGFVVRDGAGYSLAGETGLLPLDPGGSAPLTKLLGSKIWATGALQHGRLQLSSYGIIRGGE